MGLPPHTRSSNRIWYLKTWGYHLTQGVQTGHDYLITWGYQLEHEVTSSKIELPAQTWGYQLKNGVTSSNMGLPAQKWGYQMWFVVFLRVIWLCRKKILLEVYVLLCIKYLTELTSHLNSTRGLTSSNQEVKF